MKDIKILFGNIITTMYYEHIGTLNTMINDLIHTEPIHLIDDGIMFHLSELDEFRRFRRQGVTIR
jgi:hypothetical protein